MKIPTSLIFCAFDPSTFKNLVSQLNSILDLNDDPRLLQSDLYPTRANDSNIRRMFSVLFSRSLVHLIISLHFFFKLTQNSSKLCNVECVKISANYEVIKN